MTAIGGSVESISINGREFAVTADADVTMRLGGRQSESAANGNGTARIIKTAVTAMLASVVVECDNARGDIEFLQDISDNSDFVATAVTYADGSVYEGRAIVEGELTYSAQAATASFSMSAAGGFSKQG